MTRPETAEGFVARKNSQWRKDRERGGTVRAKDIGRRGRWIWTRQDWEWVPQTNNIEKVFVAELLRYERLGGDVSSPRPTDVEYFEYRLGYWIVAKIGRRAGQWTWGQFSPLIPIADLTHLLDAVRRIEARWKRSRAE